MLQASRGSDELSPETDKGHINIWYGADEEVSEKKKVMVGRKLESVGVRRGHIKRYIFLFPFCPI